MKNQNFLILLIFAVMIIVPFQLYADETITKSEADKPAKIDNSSTISVKAYYFHGARRCKTCLALESNAKKALETFFPEEMDQRIIAWQAVNTDQKENKHFEKEYDLMFSSLIFAKYKGDKQVEWKNLHKVWQLVRDESAFEEYVQKEMKAYLEN